jgi:PKD repeat protein
MNQYTEPGLYTVKLIVTGPGGIDSTINTDYIQVDHFAPTADFTADVTTGIVPLNVNFTDQSLDSINTWHWDFGDGITSPVQNPAHQYQAAGIYTVSLTVSGPGGSNTSTKTDYIIVHELPPVADFTGDPQSGYFPLQVSFTDQTGGPVDTWKWYFGDGNTSDIQNPIHTYENEGNYTVSLVSTGPGGMDSIAKEDYISVMVGLEEFGEEGFVVYPNPASDIVRIRYRMPDAGYRMIELFMISGKRIRIIEEGTVLPGIYQTAIDISDLEDGVYLLRIQIGSEITVKKLVVRD